MLRRPSWHGDNLSVYLPSLQIWGLSCLELGLAFISRSTASPSVARSPAGGWGRGSCRGLPVSAHVARAGTGSGAGMGQQGERNARWVSLPQIYSWDEPGHPGLGVGGSEKHSLRPQTAPGRLSCLLGWQRSRCGSCAASTEPRSWFYFHSSVPRWSPRLGCLASTSLQR